MMVTMSLLNQISSVGVAQIHDATGHSDLKVSVHDQTWKRSAAYELDAVKLCLARRKP